MDLDRLGRSPVGRLVPISGQDARWGPFSYFAFVPAPLPPTVPLSEATVSIVADAAMALGRLDAAATQIPNPSLLVRPALRKEAVSTSALEGTVVPLTEVLEGELAERQAVSAEAREVINYIDAAETAVDRLAARPISLKLLSELQDILVYQTRGQSYDSGQLRKRQVLIGSHDAPIEKSRFIPAPPGEYLENGVSDWERWIHEEKNMHLIVRVALGHYQFETLHPFSDGNGRLGRLVVTLQLMEGGALRYPLLNIAEWLEPRKSQYLDNLFEVSCTGNLDKWVAFFSTGIKEQAHEATGRIDRLLKVRTEILAKVQAAKSRGGTAYRIADEVIGFPILDIPRVASRYNLRYQSAQQAVERLVTLGILRELRRQGRTRRLFYSPDVLRELER